jgi:hypothetical protein
MNAEKRGSTQGANHSIWNGILKNSDKKGRMKISCALQHRRTRWRVPPWPKSYIMAGSAIFADQAIGTHSGNAAKKGHRISDTDGDERDAKKQDKHQNDVECSGNDEIQHGIPLS